ncbi:VOC family protein [Sphingosinicella terrae]|uniref:VOC family protein n=1 Tax=Sphingosinicella terrae TaxID=2172047 RepID=UPI000E0D8C92|nr:VOC family protein [Sphingosinicella terrae]
MPNHAKSMPTVNHVGMTVPDLDAALAWYQEVLGFTVMTKPVEMSSIDPVLGESLLDMLGPRVRRFRMAHLQTGNRVGIQVFEFIDPAPEPAEGEVAYWRSGFTHICVTHPDIEGLAAKIEAHGGRRSRVWAVIEGVPYAAAYCADPFGNVIEINSHGYEETRTFLMDEEGMAGAYGLPAQAQER